MQQVQYLRNVLLQKALNRSRTIANATKSLSNADNTTGTMPALSYKQLYVHTYTCCKHVPAYVWQRTCKVILATCCRSFYVFLVFWFFDDVATFAGALGSWILKSLNMSNESFANKMESKKKAAKLCCCTMSWKNNATSEAPCTCKCKKVALTVWCKCLGAWKLCVVASRRWWLKKRQSRLHWKREDVKNEVSNLLFWLFAQSRQLLMARVVRVFFEGFMWIFVNFFNKLNKNSYMYEYILFVATIFKYFLFKLWSSNRKFYVYDEVLVVLKDTKSSSKASCNSNSKNFHFYLINYFYWKRVKSVALFERKTIYNHLRVYFPLRFGHFSKLRLSSVVNTIHHTTGLILRKSNMCFIKWILKRFTVKIEVFTPIIRK